MHATHSGLPRWEASLEIDVLDLGSTIILRPRGDLDLASAGSLELRVRDFVARDQVEHVVVDLAGLTFMDGAGLRGLLVVRNTAARHHLALTLLPGPRQVQRLLALSRTAGLFRWGCADAVESADLRGASSVAG